MQHQGSSFRGHGDLPSESLKFVRSSSRSARFDLERGAGDPRGGVPNRVPARGHGLAREPGGAEAAGGDGIGPGVGFPWVCPEPKNRKGEQLLCFPKQVQPKKVSPVIGGQRSPCN